MSDCLERMILPALLSGRCSSIRLANTPVRVAFSYNFLPPGICCIFHAAGSVYIAKEQI